MRMPQEHGALGTLWLYAESFVDNPFVTQEWQYRVGEKLVGVGYVDHLPEGLSAIYFYYDPAVAAEVAAYVNYICPVEGAKEEMEKIDPSLVDSPLIFPTADDLANVKVLRSLEPDEETSFSEQFQQVIGN